MSEIISIYELRDPDVMFPMDRDVFYNEQEKIIKRTGKATKALEAIAVLLFSKDGEIILQKRSHLKHHNPYLIDKAVGGHIKYGDSPMFTIMMETVQELRVPSIVLRNNEDFKKTYFLLQTYLDSVALIKELDHDFINLNRIIGGVTYLIPHKMHIYIGVYNGSTKPVDKEASGVLYYDLDILKKEIEAQPNNFTHDLIVYLKKYEKEIKIFLKHFK